MDIDKIFPWGFLGLVLFIITIIRNARYVDRVEKERKLKEAEAARKLDELGNVDYMTMTFTTSEEASIAQNRVWKQRRQQGKGLLSSPGIGGNRETGYRLSD